MTALHRNPATIVGVVVVALLACTALAFAAVPFHAGTNQAATNSTVETAIAGNASSEFHGRLSLYADGPASDIVADGVANRLETDGLTVDRLDTLNGSHASPVVAVRVTHADVAWNPLTPTASTRVTFAYVASGNGTLADRVLRDQSLTLSSNGDRYVVHGTVGLRHAGSGIYSIPGYRRLVFDRTAAEVTDVLRTKTRE